MRKIKYVSKPFAELELRKRAVYILYLAGFTRREIKALIGASNDFLTASIKKGYAIYKK